METFCVNLWMMLSRVIGTEEQVLIRRRVLELGSKFLYMYNVSQKRRLIISGSRAEGLDLKGSDYDFMSVYDSISVSMSDTLVDQDSDVVIETDNIKPGFVRLRCRPNIINKYKDIGQLLVQMNNGFFLSSLFFRDMIVDEIKKDDSNAFAHGPCASTVDTGYDRKEYDFMECLSCNTWPSMEWRYRFRQQNWPPDALVEDIIQEGCLLVPIGNPNSQHNFMEWRISFSVAEKRLVHSFNYTQFLCYGLLKLFLKHVINSNLEVKDLLCSYFLKTSLFYCIEEESISWCKENMFDCFWTCFRRLLKWVQQAYCPNYFIRENNMFEGKICGSKQRALLRYLSELDAEGLDSLRRIPCLSGLFGPEFPRIIPSNIERQEKELRCDRQLRDTMYPSSKETNDENFKNLAILGNMMNEATSYIDKAILQIWYNNGLSALEQFLYRDTLRSMPNKTRYKAVKYLKCHMIINGMNGDVCIQKLLLAVSCYLNREYQEAVSIVEKALRVHGKYLTMIYNYQVYLDEICGKGYTLKQKIELGLFSDWFECVLFNGLYPEEIRTELYQCAVKGLTLIPTIVYFNVLLVLSYYKLKLKHKMKCALNELYLAVHGKQYHAFCQRIATSLLDKCLEVVGEE